MNPKWLEIIEESIFRGTGKTADSAASTDVLLTMLEKIREGKECEKVLSGITKCAITPSETGFSLEVLPKDIAEDIERMSPVVHTEFPWFDDE